MHNALSSRIKILSSLDIAEQRLPQDGSMSHTFFDEDFDIRVSTIPTSYGEGIVLRILSKNVSLFNLESLGFEEDTANRLMKQLKKNLTASFWLQVRQVRVRQRHFMHHSGRSTPSRGKS